MKKRIMLKRAVHVLILSTAAAVPAVAAQTSGPDGGEMQNRFFQADTNGDGVVSHDEMLTRAQDRFAEWDADGNGFLALEELPREMPGMGKRRMRHHASGEGDGEVKRKPTRMRFMARLDNDGDELLSVDEFTAPMIKRFKRADADGDGAVTQAEFDEAKETMRRRFRRGRHHQGG